MTPNRQLKWELWAKPYSKTEPEFQSESELEKVTAGGPKSKWKDSYEEKDDDDEESNLVVITNHGPMPIKMYGDFSKNFPVYVAHTNFEVDQDVKDLVMAVPGVIFFKPCTPNEFRVAFGKLFNDKKVRLAIQDVLGAYPRLEGECNPMNIKLPNRLKDIMLGLIEDVKKTKYWAVLLLPNEVYDFIGTDIEKDFEDKYGIYKEIQEITSAIIYSSTDA